MRVTVISIVDEVTGEETTWRMNWSELRRWKQTDPGMRLNNHRVRLIYLHIYQNMYINLPTKGYEMLSSDPNRSIWLREYKVEL